MGRKKGLSTWTLFSHEQKKTPRGTNKLCKGRFQHACEKPFLKPMESKVNLAGTCNFKSNRGFLFRGGMKTWGGVLLLFD